MPEQELKVLIVEDAPIDAELILFELRKSGIKCVSRRVETEQAFRDALAEWVPDLILSDFSLPQFDGLSALAIARESLPEAPFIHVSGTIGEELAIQSLKNGATDYVLKSNLARLVPAVQRAMQLAEERSARKHAEDELRLAASALANTADAVMITDTERRIVSVNRAFCKMTGFSEEESLGQPPQLLRSGKHDEAFYEQIWNAVGTSGQWQGEVWSRRKNGEIYPQWISISELKDEHGRVRNYVSVSNDVSKHKQYEERLEFLAHHDPLTGLANRAFFLERLEATLVRAHRDRASAGLLFIDLDRFKSINDSLGHAVGDQFLKALAQRLQECVRESDTVSRLGGDEFTILLYEVREPQDAATIAQKVLDAVAKPFILEGHEIFSSASIGISCYPQDGKEAELLVQHADLAMYRAKQVGRNNYQFFSAGMNVKALGALVITNSLRQALDQNEFSLIYQPRVDLRSGWITSVEAQLRWQHPERGLLLPAEFVPLAEETGLMGAVDDWVLKNACATGRNWQKRGIKSLRIAVKLSPYHFNRLDLLNRISAALDETGFQPAYLELPMTESMVMQYAKGLEPFLTQLNDMGVRIAIDDFGVGYSSLNNLKRFPVHYLKVDRSFVRDLPANSDDCEITRAIIAMAKSLKLTVIAEGIENVDQLAFLRNAGCDEGQGYLFGAAMPSEEIEQLLRSERITLEGVPTEV